MKRIDFTVSKLIVIMLLIEICMQQCPTFANCNTCNGSGDCLTCASGYSFLPSGSIGCCQSGNTWSNNGVGCVTCPISLNCNRCDTSNMCASCSTNFFSLPSSAAGCCPTGYTWSVTISECVTCSSTLNCNRCDSPNICSDCSASYSFWPTDVISIGCCLTGFTWSSVSGVNCVACPSSL